MFHKTDRQEISKQVVCLETFIVSFVFGKKKVSFLF